MDFKKYPVEFVKTEDLKPYELNAKTHPEEQVELIARSIKEFGFRQNLVIDDNNSVVIGHGRLLAAQKLGLPVVPCMRVKDLTQAQIRALRIADNRVAESPWDLEVLNLELQDLDFDMSDFGIDLFSIDEQENTDVLDDVEDAESPWGDMRSSLQHNVFENQERMQFPSDNFYGIPNIEATQTYGAQLLRFCDYNDVTDHQNYIAHFYYDDYKFIQAWRQPDSYIEKLRQFKAVISPDFSLYTDFPRALQILSCYRRQWCGAYWQAFGIDVIPDVVWGDKESFNYCFEGIPKHSVVAVSSVGVTNDDNWNGKDGDMFRDGYKEMLERLEPTKIMYYGTLIDGLEGDIIRIPSFYEQKRQMLNERSKIKYGNENKKKRI